MACQDVMRIRLHVPGIKVLEVVEDLPERLVVAVVLIRAWVRCSACGFKTRRVHQTKTVKIRDLPVSGRPMTLEWHRRRFRCERCKTTTSETSPHVKGKLTCRFRRALFEEVVDSTVNKVRRRHGLSWTLVMAVVTERVELIGAHRCQRPVRVLCIDEKRLTKGYGPFSTIISDGEAGRVLAVIDGRSGDSLQTWLNGQSPRWRRRVRVVVTDMASCWRAPIAALPNADHVVDRFHVVRAALSVLTQARRTAQRTERGKPHDRRVFQARFVLMTRADRLDAAQQAELVSLFGEHPQLAAAWELCQRFHRVFEADGVDAALAAVDELADAMERTGHSFAPGVRALLRWETQWRNYHLTGGWTTNCAEGLNTKIELLERRCYGFTNPDNHKARILADCSGHHRVNTPAKTRRATVNATLTV